ncbi:MAG: flavin reductase family protein [Trueperaceae bacterium]
MIEPQEFRNALGRFPSGVTVVTAMDGDEPRGITVSSFMSLSLEPPLIAIAIDEAAVTHGLLQPGRHFGVSILRRGQEFTSDYYASRPVPLPEPLLLSDGFPFVPNSLARLLCRVIDAHKAGDHTIFIGEVERLSYEEGEPMLYHRGRYVEVIELDLADG